MTLEGHHNHIKCGFLQANLTNLIKEIWGKIYLGTWALNDIKMYLLGKIKFFN